MRTDEILKTAALVGLSVAVAKALLAPDMSWGKFLFGMPANQRPSHGLQGQRNNGVNPSPNALLRAFATSNQAHPQGQAAALPTVNPVSVGTRDFLGEFAAEVERMAPLAFANLVPTKSVASPDVIEAGNWRRLVPHPSIVLVLGKRGSGKSALGYRLLELSRYVATPYVVGLPAEARKVLPEWVGMAASLEDVPPKAIAVVDEAYLPYHARSSMAAEARAMSQLLNLSRQREQTIIFISQEARQVDRNIASSANVVVFKDLGALQLAFDRPELNRIASQARQAFAAIDRHKERWSYVYSPDADHTGLVENSLPSFWKEKLSHIFATGEGVFSGRAPRKTPLAERMERAKALKQQGLSLGQIAKLMGVTKPTIKNYLEGYPYKA